jgi:hypothetical protein
MVSTVVVVLEELLDALFELSWQVVVVQQDPVFHRATVSALVNTERPIIMIYDPDQGHPDQYAEIKFKTRDDANAAVTKLNTIFKTATRITLKQPRSNLGV